MDKEDVVYMEYYSAIKKKNEILPFATWLYLDIVILSEICQREKDKILYIITYMWDLKIKQVNVHNKTETDSQI